MADRRTRRPWRQAPRLRGLLVAVALLGLVAAACTPEPPAPDASPQMAALPGIFPDWQPLISDYVVRCNDQPVHFMVNSPSGIDVSVNGSPPTSGEFGIDVPLTVGKRFLVQTTGAQNGTYSVRCIPNDFPASTVTGSGPTQAEFYITAPAYSFPSYPAIYDAHGVPIWWGPKAPTAFAQLLANGHVAWTNSIAGQPAEEQTLDGTPVQSINTSTAADSGPALPPSTVDLHDLLHLAGGNYLVVGNYERDNADFSSWGTGAPTDAPVFDQILEEIDPTTGNVVWSWDVYDHIPVSETDPQWHSGLLDSGPTPIGYDAYHWNSVEETPTEFIVSFRHLDAVYAINRATGAIDWKLGGTTTPQSLQVLGDPVFDGLDPATNHFGGQHDARVNPDGTVSLYDDGTDLGRAPRAVRYTIDTGAHTATLVETVRNPTVAPSSFCCGSARRLPGGNWVIGWGGRNSFSEVDPSGNEVFGMQFPNALMYRALPILPGVLSLNALRADMDQMATTLGASTLEAPSGPIQMP